MRRYGLRRRQEGELLFHTWKLERVEDCLYRGQNVSDHSHRKGRKKRLSTVLRPLWRRNNLFRLSSKMSRTPFKIPSAMTVS